MSRVLAMISPEGQREMHSRLPVSVLNSGRLIAGSVRNPWDWYVSLWGYGCDGKGVVHEKLTEPQRIGGHGLIRSPSEGICDLLHDLKRNRKFWMEVYSDSDSPELFRKWLNALLTSYGRDDMRGKYTRSSLSGFAGFYTYRYCYLFHDTYAHLFDGSIGNMQTLREADMKHNMVDHVIRMENITEGIMEMLKVSGTSVDSAFGNRITSLEKTNPSSRKMDFSLYYDKPTSELVGRREALIIEKYGYSPPKFRQLSSP